MLSELQLEAKVRDEVGMEVRVVEKRIGVELMGGGVGLEWLSQDHWG
jgi:hypothetical protein